MAQNPDNPPDNMNNPPSYTPPPAIPPSAIAQASREDLEEKLYDVIPSYIREHFIPRILTLQTECQSKIDNSPGDKKNEYYPEQSALNILQKKCIEILEKKNSANEQKDSK